jgi:anti-sigma regulatory factor (Ser/Thr protein kinase)
MTEPLPLSEDRMFVAVDDPATAGGVRRAAVALGAEAHLGEAALGKLGIAATEVATNLARHATGGVVLLRLCRTGDRTGVEIVATDTGPGIGDVDQASVDGRSTAGTLGIGLGAIRRLTTGCDIYSQPGSGTVLAASVWDHPAPPPTWFAGVRRPIDGEAACGDGYAARAVHGRRQVLLCDGLGHGALAEAAAQVIVSAFADAPAAGPKAVLDHLHAQARPTRGAVAAVAELDPEAGVVRFAGTGNISATVGDTTGRRVMVSMPGILGHQRQESREFEYPLRPTDLVVLHSDGLTDRWRLDSYPGLVTHSPIVVAAALLRDAGRRRDDASVLVARAA